MVKSPKVIEHDQLLKIRFDERSQSPIKRSVIGLTEEYVSLEQ